MIHDALGNELQEGDLVLYSMEHGDNCYAKITKLEQGSDGRLGNAPKPAKIAIQPEVIFIAGRPDGNVPVLLVLKNPKTTAAAASG